MDLSPLNKLVGMFDGAESLGGFGPGSYQGPGQRIRGSARLFAEFYTKRFVEQHADKVKIIPLNNGVVREKVESFKIVPVDKLMVRIIDPGDRYNIFDNVATDEHKKEFAQEYIAFREGRNKPVGTALTDAPFITEGAKLELNRIHIHTLEQLRDASDAAMEAIGSDYYDLRTMAKNWLGAAEVNVEKKRIADLEAKIAELTNQVNGKTESVEKKRGRPKKDEEEIILPSAA